VQGDSELRQRDRVRIVLKSSSMRNAQTGIE
jgi:hypothetical protein